MKKSLNTLNQNISGLEMRLHFLNAECFVVFIINYSIQVIFSILETFKEIVLQLNGVHEIMVLYGQGVLGDLYKNYLLNKDFDEKESTNG